MKTMFCHWKPKAMIANPMTSAIDHGPAADNKGSAIARYPFEHHDAGYAAIA